MTKKEQLLVIDPPTELIFNGPFDNVVLSSIRLTNPTDKVIAFKIKTTTPKQYCVKPNFGFVRPTETVSISITLQPFKYNPEEKYRHKFMVQSVTLHEDDTTGSINWEKFAPDELMDLKLLCVFHMPEADLAYSHTESSGNDLQNVSSGNSDGASGEPNLMASKMSSNEFSSPDARFNDLIKDSKQSDVEVTRLSNDLRNALDEVDLLRDELRASQKEHKKLKGELMNKRTSQAASNQYLNGNLMQNNSNLTQLHFILIAVAIALVGIIIGKFIV